MKILIYGAGVIGCTYGLQLSKTENEVDILVRKGKKKQIDENGIKIFCTDYRSEKRKEVETVFRPKVIDELSPQNDYDYIIVSVAGTHIDDTLTELSETVGKAQVLFFLNLWDLERIDKYLRPDQYLVGFPFMAGGGKNEDGIHSIIANTKYSKTMLGQLDGKQTERVLKIAHAMEEAGMKPFVSEQILNWIVPHYVFIAGLSAGILKAGGKMKAFTANTAIVKETIKAIKEGFRVCEARGIDPRKEKVNKLYYLPLFIATPVVKKVFSDEVMVSMFDGYLQYASKEIEMMLGNIIASGKLKKVNMPCLEYLLKTIKKL